jgi:hypothetical protein
MESEPKQKQKRAYKTRNRMSESDKLVRDLNAGYKANRKLIIESMKQCSVGTNSYLAHVKALDKQLLEYAEFRREIGVLPKNVHAETATQFVFKAHVSKGGNVSTVPVSTPAQMQELERAEAREVKRGYADSPEDEAVRAAFDEQFSGGAEQTESK